MTLIKQEQSSPSTINTPIPSGLAQADAINAITSSTNIQLLQKIGSPPAINKSISHDSPAVHNHQTIYNNTNSITNQYRVDLESLIDGLTSVLGKENWTKYAQLLSLFILGKLSRKELCRDIDSMFKNILTTTTNDSTSKETNDSNNNTSTNTNANTSNTSLSMNSTTTSNMYYYLIKLHNQILIGIYNNSIRSSDNDEANGVGSWGFGNNSNNKLINNKFKRVNKHNSQIENYKKVVMSLPIHDRERLKSITKEAGKRGFVLCSILQARLNQTPKIPIVTNPDTLKRIKTNNLKTPLEWSQDIMNGFNSQLSTESYSLPDKDTVFLRMVGIAREHGLVGTVNAQCVEILLTGLEHYLKDIVSTTIDSVRYREKRYSDYYDTDENGVFQPVSEEIHNNNFSSSDNSTLTDSTKFSGINSEVENVVTSNPIISLTNDDLFDSMQIFPNSLENSNAHFNLLNSTMMNDDELIVTHSSIDDLPDFTNLEDRPSFSPRDKRNIGSRIELNWLIKDILTEK
ncbi:hypothetical protein TBLA_0G01720 [Henningerozyma blattae CBS 6284]|uniref:Transcriptional coactivator HFI1/ADA1 n=1 Tax=Henningerozyma blattae (strain ATCC 34711 / CBS 6284 / DSM 70876 / NBRC 10599 / NRRL Y-10934 / UCD 77-7) TaxID=1071380 RepID=I2H6W4_HENB6|nr:hypothetical protein TBLA_0G01720 [Tetrapisispora blattae CBS 6284]CCH62116.1 hypothetical protein TBLA_0G01720 [Tetrapisispora blattae CBS 6284]